jgi:peroxiredoxin
MRISRIGVLAAAALALVALPAFAGSPAIGSTAPDFQLTTLDGKPFTLSRTAAGQNATVIMFIATKCPYSNAYNDRMREMAEAYRAKGVLFVGINSNKTEPAEEAREHAKTNRHTFPIMKDPDNKVADMYDAKRTPEIFVVDKQGKVVYHGRIDENYEDPKGVTSPDLKNALDALLTGKPIVRAETKAFGCTIKRV